MPHAIQTLGSMMRLTEPTLRRRINNRSEGTLSTYTLILHHCCTQPHSSRPGLKIIWLNWTDFIYLQTFVSCVSPVLILPVRNNFWRSEHLRQLFYSLQLRDPPVLPLVTDILKDSLPEGGCVSMTTTALPCFPRDSTRWSQQDAYNIRQ